MRMNFASGAAAGFVVTLALVAALSLALNVRSIHAADWLQFGGAIVATALGSAITVGGALYLVEWQAEKLQRRAVATMESLLADSRLAGNELYADLKMKSDNRDWIERLARIQAETLMSARDVALHNRALSAGFARACRLLDLPDQDLNRARHKLDAGGSSISDETFDAIQGLVRLADAAETRLKAAEPRHAATSNLSV